MGAGGRPSSRRLEGSRSRPLPRDRPLRVLMVSDFFYPNAGGVESHIYALSQLLIARGHSVAVLTHEHGSCAGTRQLTNGLTVVYAPRRAVWSGATLPTVAGGCVTAARAMRRHGSDLVHAHQAFSPLAHEALLAARSLGVPCVFTDHSLFGFADLGSILVNKALKFSLAGMRHVICVSHTSKENSVLRAGVRPAAVAAIPNAVDTSRFPARCGRAVAAPGVHEAERATEAEAELQGPAGRAPGGSVGTGGRAPPTADEVVIVVLNRLTWRKGTDLLAAALPHIVGLRPGVRVVVGGDGPRRGVLEETVARHGLGDRVELLGAVAPAEVPSVLRRGHVFLNCSLTEAFCIALVEAAASGLAVASTNVGGVPEVLPPGVVSLGAPSVDGLVRAVEGALARLPALDPAAQHALVASCYSWDSVAARTARVYRRALAAPRWPDSLAHRATRYARCGLLFGPLCCCFATFVWILLNALDAAGALTAGGPIESFPARPSVGADGGRPSRAREPGLDARRGRHVTSDRAPYDP